MPDIVKRVVSDYQDLPAHGIPDIDEWLGGEDLIDRIKIRLLNKEANEDMITTRKLVSYENMYEYCKSLDNLSIEMYTIN